MLNLGEIQVLLANLKIQQEAAEEWYDELMKEMSENMTNNNMSTSESRQQQKQITALEEEIKKQAHMIEHW